MSDSSNVTIRLPINGGVDRPITYEELDSNFLELINIINEYNSFVTNEFVVAQRRVLLEISKPLLESQLYFEPGVENVFTVSGDKLTVPASTILYSSGLIPLRDTGMTLNASGVGAGGVRVQIKGYDVNGAQVTSSTDTDFVVNGSNRSFELNPTFAPVSNSETDITVEFTELGKSKAAFYTVSVQTSGAGTFDFSHLIING